MRTSLILYISLSIFPLAAQTQAPTARIQSPVVLPPVARNPNIAPPNDAAPPAPNPPNPYDPYGSRAGAPGSPFSEANQAAMHFLNIMDNQAYGGAWLDASGVVQDVVPQEVWTAGLHAYRTHLGPVKSRVVSSHYTTNTLPGGTPGEFVIIEYQTQFSRKSYSTEVVTVKRHPPIGIWRVVSYRIK